MPLLVIESFWTLSENVTSSALRRPYGLIADLAVFQGEFRNSSVGGAMFSDSTHAGGLVTFIAPTLAR
eukprot:3178838-Pyramimonas_sp.AAC.1